VCVCHYSSDNLLSYHTVQTIISRHKSSTTAEFVRKQRGAQKVDHFISFRCLQRLHYTLTENLYNISTVSKTLIKMSTVRCNDWSQSSPKLSHCPVYQIKSVRCKHVYLWLHQWPHTEYLTQTILQSILILYRLQILSLASTFYKNETIVYLNNNNNVFN